jgi:hypothetical protein
MTTATSLVLIAIGAILAFAVSTQVAGINIQTVGVILVIVGGIGLCIGLATIAGYSPWATAGRGAAQPPTNAAPATNPGPTANVTAPVIVTPPANPAPPRV